MATQPRIPPREFSPELITQYRRVMAEKSPNLDALSLLGEMHKIADKCGVDFKDVNESLESAAAARVRTNETTAYEGVVAPASPGKATP
jgi:hypothetical protein